MAPAFTARRSDTRFAGRPLLRMKNLRPLASWPVRTSGSTGSTRSSASSAGTVAAAAAGGGGAWAGDACAQIETDALTTTAASTPARNIRIGNLLVNNSAGNTTTQVH